jgi:hypothetical protein
MSELTPEQAERVKLEGELAELRLKHPFPTAPCIQEWFAKQKALEERISKLPKPPQLPVDPRVRRWREMGPRT